MLRNAPNDPAPQPAPRPAPSRWAAAGLVALISAGLLWAAWPSLRAIVSPRPMTSENSPGTARSLCRLAVPERAPGSPVRRRCGL